MARLLTFFVTIALASFSEAQDARIELAIRKKMDETEDLRNSQIQIIEAMANGRILSRNPIPASLYRVGGKPRFRFQTKEAKESAIAKANEKLRYITNVLILPELIMRDETRVGDFGRLPTMVNGDSDSLITYEIMQILDESNMLVIVSVPELVIERSQYVGELAQVQRIEKHHSVIMKTDTRGLRDGAQIEFNAFFQITGTTQYNTAIGGTRTVFVLEEIDVNPLIHRLQMERQSKQQLKFEKVGPEKERQPGDKAEQDQLERQMIMAHMEIHSVDDLFEEQESSEKPPVRREWTDVSGVFKLTATLVSSDGQTVLLRTTDGNTIEVSVTKLSLGDREYLSQQVVDLQILTD